MIALCVNTNRMINPKMMDAVSIAGNYVTRRSCVVLYEKEKQRNGRDERSGLLTSKGSHNLQLHDRNGSSTGKYEQRQKKSESHRDKHARRKKTTNQQVKDMNKNQAASTSPEPAK